MTPDAPRPYTVALSGVVQEQFLELLYEAHRQGRWDEVSRAVEALHAALRWAPEVVAEPGFDVPVLGRIQAGSFGPIQLKIAVNDDTRVVQVGWVRLNPPDRD